jgi:glycosyltransferase involved in cell wall biosynthesis
MLDPAGSSAQVSHSLCKHLSELGCDVHVFTAPHWLRVSGANTTYRKRICFYRGTQMRSYNAQNAVYRMFWRIVRLMQHVWAMISICVIARKFDVVHTQILPLPAFDYFCLRVIAHRTPVVCTVHELVPHQSKYRRFTGACFGAIYRLARVLFVYTEYTGNRLVAELDIPREKVLKVPHGSLERLLDMKPNPVPSPSDEPPVVLFVGNIRADKGVDILIKAASYLRGKVPSFRLQIAGTPGIDVTALRDSALELGLQDCVEFHLGFLPEQEFAAYLSRATVVALPYRRIEQSGVAIAACTFGKAIVATRCGGLEELITEADNGLLVPIDDPIAFAEALATLILDGERRKACERRSKEYADTTLSWAPIASKTVAGYRIAMGQPGDLGHQVVTEQT